jgi:hypothetical protein
MLNEVRNAFSAHNVDQIINGAMNEMIETKNEQMYSQNHLLKAYAERENNKVSNIKDKDFTPYFTEIVKASDSITAKNIKASEKADQEFATVFNSVYADGAVKINIPSDPSMLNSYIDYSPYRVNYAEYLSVPTLSEMVDRPISIALKKFPKVKSDNEEFNKAIEKIIDRKKLKSVIKDAIFYSVLSPRGSLVVPILKNNSVFFNVFNDTQFAYGMGASYSGVTAPYHTVKVGDLYCMGAKLRHGVSAYFTCPGYEPLFGVGLNRVPQLRTAAEAWNLYVHILKILMVRSQIIIEKMEGDIQTDTMLSKMRSQLQRLSQTMGVSTPIEQARGQTLDILNNNISSGTADIASVFKDFVASVTGLAPEYFFGGGNSAYSQAAFQIHTTNENINSRYQVGMIEPLLRFMVNTMIRYDSTLSAFEINEDEFDIKFDSIYEETEQEKTELRGKKTEILIRQCSYPELEEAFKKEDLLSDDIELPKITVPTAEEDKKIDDDSKDSTLTKPLQ